MNSPLTLHAFVINLLSNADARTAFHVDPDGALADAGLSDVTAADVQDIIPLVADYAPANVAALDTSLPEFSSSTLGADRSGAIHQLQYVASQVPLGGTASDLTVAAAGGMGSVTSAASGLAGGVPAFAGGAPLFGGTDFSYGSGPSHGADLSGGAGGSASFPGGGASFHGGFFGGADGSAGAGLAGGFSPAHDLTGTLDAGLSDVTAGLSGVTTGLSGTLDAGTAPITDALHGTVGGALGGTLGGGLGGLGDGGGLGGVGDGLGHDPVGSLGSTVGGVTHGLGGVLSNPLDTGDLVDHGGLTGGLPVVGGGGSGLDAVTGALSGGSGALGLGAASDSAATTDHAGSHLLDLPHLL